MKYKLSIIFLCTCMLSALHGETSTHVLQSGETLYSLARRYQVSLTELMELNNITSATEVRAGTVLMLPGSSSGQTISADTSPSGQAIEHTVKKGDTYYSIARLYKINLTEMMGWLNRDTDTPLKIGEILQIKATGHETSPVTDNSTAIKSVDLNIIDEDHNNPAPDNQPELTSPANSLEKSPAVMKGSDKTNLPVIDNITWPVSGVVSPNPGRQRGVKIDIQGEQTIRALSQGVVVYKGSYRELKNAVLVQHAGGYAYLYSGFDYVYVKIGDKIDAGASLGKASVNNTIIFSVFKDGNPINPSIAPRD